MNVMEAITKRKQK